MKPAPEPLDPERDRQTATRFAARTINDTSCNDRDRWNAVRFAILSGVTVDDVAQEALMGAAEVQAILDAPRPPADEAHEARRRAMLSRPRDPDKDRARALDLARWAADDGGDLRGVMRFAAESGASPADIAEATGVELEAVHSALRR